MYHMISTFFKPILLVAIIFCSALANANLFDNPYQGNVMVGTFSESTLKEMALNQVLIKVSGNTHIVLRAESKLLLKQIQPMLSQYGYQKYQGTEYFFALFDKPKINKALRDMQQPVWGDTRPGTLIWLIENNKLLSDHAINRPNDTSISLPVQKNQYRRGIRLQFPLMDLDDNLALSVSDVRGRFYEPIANASSRYGLNHFVVAELKALDSGKWTLSWELVTADKPFKKNIILVSETLSGTKSVVMSKMVNAIADYYAGKYAIVDNDGEKFIQTVHINGIDSLAKLYELKRVMNNFLAAVSFKIIDTEGELITIDVKIRGGFNHFKDVLIAQPNLQFISTPPTESDTNKTDDLYFNWRKE